MGLLKHLLFWPVTGPTFLTKFALGQVEGVVREQLTDDSPVKSELLELQMRLELGEIDDDEYVRREAELMQRLREVREWRERFGMSVPGGAVRVAGADDTPLAELPDASGPAAASGGDDAGADEARAPESAPRVADPSGASIEINLDWD